MRPPARESITAHAPSRRRLSNDRSGRVLVTAGMVGLSERLAHGQDNTANRARYVKNVTACQPLLLSPGGQC